MDSIILGGSSKNLYSLADRFHGLCGAVFEWQIVDAYIRQLISTPGKLKNFRVKLNGSPGSGKSYTFTIRKNGEDTSLVVVIADSDTEGSDTTHEVTVSAADELYIKCSPSNTPTTRQAHWGVQFAGDNSKESNIIGGIKDGLSQSVVEYNLVMGGCTWSSLEDECKQIVPTSGKLKNLYVKLTTAPGTGKSRTFTLRKNGEDTALTVTISDSATEGNDTVHEITMAAGDIVSLKSSPSSSPDVTFAFWGMTFLADTDGESILLGGSKSDPGYNVSYNVLTGASVSWGSEGSAVQLAPCELILKKLYVWRSDTTGTSIHTIRKSAADTDIEATITSGNQTGNDTTHTASVSEGDSLAMKLDQRAFTYPDHAWGCVCFILAVVEKDFSEVGNGTEAFGIPLKALPFSEIGGGAEAYATPYRTMGFSEQGLGSDVFSKDVTFLSVQFSDAGSGVDVFETSYREMGFVDAGYGADAFQVAVYKYFVDVGNGADVFESAFKSMAFAETGEGADVFESLYRGVYFPDTGCGEDVFAKDIILLDVAFSDAGAGSDAFSIPYKTKDFSETGTGSDTYGVFLNQLAFSAAGEGADAFGSWVVKTFSDVGSGVDAFEISHKEFEFWDAGLGADVFTMTVELGFTDVGSGADLFQREIVGWIMKQFADSGHGSDVFAILFKEHFFVDAGFGVDSYTVPYLEVEFVDDGVGQDGYALAFKTTEFSESGLGTDVFKRDGEFWFFDTGHGEDAFSEVVTIVSVNFLDTGLGSDAFVVPHTELKFSDVGGGIEAFAVPYVALGFVEAASGADSFWTAFLPYTGKVYALSSYEVGWAKTDFKVGRAKVVIEE